MQEVAGELVPGDLGYVAADYDYSRRISTISTMSEAGESRDHIDRDTLSQIQEAQRILASRSQTHWRISHRKCMLFLYAIKKQKHINNFDRCIYN